MLGMGELDERSEWKLEAPVPGTRLMSPKPLFRKLEEEVAEEETAKLGQTLSLLKGART